MEERKAVFGSSKLVIPLIVIVVVSLMGSTFTPAFSEGPPTITRFSGISALCSPDESSNQTIGWHSLHSHVKGGKLVVNAKSHVSIYEENGKLLGKQNVLIHYSVNFEKVDRIFQQHAIIQCTDGSTANFFVIIEVSKDGKLIPQVSLSLCSDM